MVKIYEERRIPTGVCHLKKNAVLAKGQDILLEKFRAELIDYKPNWEIIIKNYKKDVSNKEFSKICGERIREFRRNTILPYEAKHLTQGRLGDLPGITKQAVSKLEKGGYVSSRIYFTSLASSSFWLALLYHFIAFVLAHN